MSPERWAALKERFDAAAELDEAGRHELLARLAAEDPELAAELASLLAADGGQPPTQPEDAWRRFRDEGPAAAPLPATIDRYKVLAELGQGGMGRVFLAERADSAYRQRVALKVLTAAGRSSPESRQRFLAERAILARLVHPGIARLIDGGTTADGEPFLVTEYVDGRPIDAYCRERGLATRAIVRLVMRVCATVEAAHRSLVVHRDLKPANVMVTADGSPRLLDFGIAKLLATEAGEPSAALTLAGHSPLTPRYASPEQLRAEPVTVATDVYSLGVMLYELLTGLSPYGEAVCAAALARAICDEEPPPPSATARRAGLARPGLDADLDAIVGKALKKDPAARYGSVAELAADLGRFLDGLPVAARRGSRLDRLGKVVRRQRWPLAAAAVAVAALAGFGLQRERQLRALEAERDKARVVADFMIEVFSTADPGEGRGPRPTIRDALDRAARGLEHQLASRPPRQGVALAALLGRLELAQGRLDDAARWFGAALETGARTSPGASPLDPAELASARAALAIVEQLQGEPARAAAHLEAAESMAREHALVDRVAAGQLASDLAMAHHLAGRPARAKALIDGAIDHLRGAVPGDHAETANALNNRGLFESELGDQEAAERSLGEALAMWRRLVGDEHPRTVLAAGNLGALLLRQRRWSEAEPLLREAMRRNRALLPPDHPDLATDRRNLGDALRAQGRFAEARTEYQAALAHEVRVLGSGSAAAAATRLALGRLAEREGAPTAALAFADEAVAALERLHPEGHPELAVARSWRGSLLAAAGRVAAARADLDAALEFQERTLPAEHRSLALTRERIAALDATAKPATP